jgi:predicted alpha/beta hydrolase family esterase
MRTGEASILIIPGHQGAGPEHWQSRWENKLKTAYRVEQSDWTTPVLADWLKALRDALQLAKQPVVLVAHGLGVAAVAHLSHSIMSNGHAKAITGAFMVAPICDEAIRADNRIDPNFAPIPRLILPFHTHVIASRNDPLCPLSAAEAMAKDWGATLANAGDVGHIDPLSGHGPWPEGLMSFGGFLARL